MVTAAGLATVGATTLVNSKEGETIAADARTVVMFPNTDNAALAVVNDANQLTSLIIATLSPSGTGGSIVTIPVNADASSGLGDTRRPVDAELDLEDPARFFETVEGTLAISLQFGEIVSADRLAALIGSVTPIDVDLSVPVVDSRAPGTGTVVGAGERRLSEPATVNVLRSLDVTGESYDHHVIDVEVWSALAASAPVAEPVEVALDDADRPVSSTTIDELFARLWSGPVQVRNLAVDRIDSGGATDAVVIDREDALLVFAQVSPARTSTPNPGLVFRVVVPYTEEQIADSGVFTSSSELARLIIGELLFFSANVVSVDTAPAPGGARDVGRIEVADDRFMPDMVTLTPLVFGDSEVVLADERVDGVDVVLTLGMDYIDLKRAGGLVAGDATGDVSDGSGDVMVDDTSPGDTVVSDG